MKKTKEQIILDMCYTSRHDYGLEAIPNQPLSCGTTQAQRDFIYKQMKQLYENCIEPYVILK